MYTHLFLPAGETSPFPYERSGQGGYEHNLLLASLRNKMNAQKAVMRLLRVC